MKNACACNSTPLKILRARKTLNSGPSIQLAEKLERLLLSHLTRTGNSRHISVTQTQVSAEFGKSRTPLDYKTFEADCNVRCPCRPPSLRIPAVCPGPLQAIPQRTIHLCRRKMTLATRKIATQLIRVSRKLHDNVKLCLDIKRTCKYADRLSSPETAIRLLLNA